jgi:Zn-dependent protease with chaperone function
VLGGVSLVAPPSEIGHLVVDVLRACVHGGPEWGGIGQAGIGSLVVLTVIARIAIALHAEVSATRRERTAHRQALALVAGHSDRWGATLVDHPAPAAYSLPGQPAHVVITAGAVAALDDEQIAAVLAHERAHLTGRHHLLLAAAAVLTRAVPWVPLFRDTSTEVARLVELVADDAAVRLNRPHRLAAALATLALTTVPGAALPAGGATVAGRIRRLLHPPAPVPRRLRIACVVAIGLVLAAPASAVLGSAAAAAYVNHHCTDTGAGRSLG